MGLASCLSCPGPDAPTPAGRGPNTPRASGAPAPWIASVPAGTGVPLAGAFHLAYQSPRCTGETYRSGQRQ
ncbi:hypothetical protein M911_02255 [Ectothiorhodospira haloalkaliphila]|uniref:Uncharacterized protein n=1 Tax=Ectothiorhodospira haloalkaliphila TaxID=421628 RepID=W8KMG8_9GAMM|nr:hypothetical protein M911_02255 [Ectothiorhodospira haloalkaliphila]